MSIIERPVLGQIFSVPLFEGGYAFGYVTFIEKKTGTLCSFFDLVSETPEVPEGLQYVTLVLEDLFTYGVEFSFHKQIPDKQWKLTKHRMPGEVRARQTKFIMQSRPVYQIVDIAIEKSKRPATDEEIARYPVLASRFPPYNTKVVEKAVRHLDIDPELIGEARGDSSLH